MKTFINGKWEYSVSNIFLQGRDICCYTGQYLIRIVPIDKPFTYSEYLIENFSGDIYEVTKLLTSWIRKSTKRSRQFITDSKYLGSYGLTKKGLTVTRDNFPSKEADSFYVYIAYAYNQTKIRMMIGDCMCYMILESNKRPNNLSLIDKLYEIHCRAKLVSTL